MSATIVHQPWLLVGQRVPPGISLNLSFMTPGTLDPSIVFTRASTGTYFDATGTLQTAAVNAPRWDYDPVAHTLNGLLIEEARTNSVLNSATLVTQNVTVTAAPWTLSFYGTGTVTKSGTASGALVGTGAGQRVSQTFTPTAGTLTLTVTGSVLNAQLEAGGSASSWIATTAASVTRAQDTMTAPIAAWFSAAQGTFETDCRFQVVPGSATGNEFIGVGPNASNLLRASLTASSSLPFVQAFNANVSRGVATVSNNVAAGAVSKNAFTYVAATLAMSTILNAGPVATVTASLFPALTTSVYFGGSGRGGLLNGHMCRVRYWPRALSAAELQSVTR